jgi:hypothetical protein
MARNNSFTRKQKQSVPRQGNKQQSQAYKQAVKEIRKKRKVKTKPLPKPILPGGAPSYEYDGWWLNIDQATLNLMCSPDSSSTWDMELGQCI